jgi:ankyrin repeat protein
MNPLGCQVPDQSFTAPMKRDLLSRQLRAAIDRRDYRACVELLDQGADPDTGVGLQKSLLSHAIALRYFDMVDLLLERGAHIDSPGIGRRSPLATAAIGGDVALCQTLIGRGASVAAQDGTREIPLHEAASRSHVNVCATLLAAGAELNEMDGLGRTALHKAAGGSRSSTVEMCRWLINYGADPDFTPDAPDETYLTPFQWAVAYGFPNVVDFLIDERPSLVHGTTLAGQTMAEIVSAINKPLILAAVAQQAIEQRVDDAQAGSAVTLSRSKGFGPL